MGDNKGLIESLLEEVNSLPIAILEYEHDTQGMELIINDGYIVDMIY